MAQITYSGPATLFYLGLPVLEATKVTLKLATNNKTVNTLSKARAGHTAGPKVYTLSVSNALPSTGPDVDWELLASEQETITLGVRFANKTYTLDGDLRDVTVESDAEGAANSIAFEFEGTMKART